MSVTAADVQERARVSTRPAAVIVLAAGEGTRMKSSIPKVLHELAGRTLVGHAVSAARSLDPEHLAVVVGHGRDLVSGHVAEIAPGIVTAVQEKQLGTGHAVQCALETLPSLRGVVVVTYGDVPLLSAETLRDLIDRHVADHNGVTVLTAHVDDPSGYGRIIRHTDGAVERIVEHKDAGDDELRINEINSGIYAFDAEVLRSGLSRLDTDNAQGELYLTDVLGLAYADGRRVGALVTADVWQTEGVNDRVQLAALHAEMNRRITTRWMRAGVTIVDPSTTWIDVTVSIGSDAVIRPGVQLHGATTIGAGAEIGPDTTLRDTTVGPGAAVVRTHAIGAEVGGGASVGPFSYLRPGTRLAEKGKIGGFVETKNADIGRGSKVPHLTYVGDATIGDGVNIGAGTIFANYDGVDKHHTTIGDHSFVGSDAVLVAPVELADGSYVAAGSVVVSGTEPGELAVGRARQRNIPDWVDRKRAGSASHEAALRARARQTGDVVTNEGD